MEDLNTSTLDLYGKGEIRSFVPQLNFRGPHNYATEYNYGLINEHFGSFGWGKKAHLHQRKFFCEDNCQKYYIFIGIRENILMTFFFFYLLIQIFGAIKKKGQHHKLGSYGL